ncbi:MAG: type II toxin-antitoxin system prevent-host-death family antitoxin [Opitutales bacterium]|nr:type II toxin-antitoxin system prevent-host-death family antitoxin [Opitutales bacterium]NRA28424.1 type II toxin-antitoxin system prevent-host-death family antitoxin [Opitutales bacterium]
MEASLIDLRRRPSRILKAVENRETVILSRRGKPIAQISPLEKDSHESLIEHEAFGIWKNHGPENVEAQIRALRDSRYRDL